jgi:signal recognition particle subunit SRP54
LFDALIKGFREAQNRLSGLTELTAENIRPALQEVRQSLLDADVELGVVKRFLARVEEKAVGQTVQIRVKTEGQTHRVTAADVFVKTCHDELVAMMGSEAEGLTIADKGLTSIVMVGLQGSGKTTTAAKLARLLKQEGKKPMLVAADMQRAAAVEQLKVLGTQIEIPVFNIENETPVGICKAAPAEAKRLGCDVIVYDTAGRLAIDEVLMSELAEVKSVTKPDNILLVIDAMIGQDAVKTARSFNERLGITGVVLTKLDGDARGGAALSVKEVTGAPIVFVGMGETTDKLEPFRPEGMASRVLGMGDVVGLIRDFEQVVDQKKAEQDALRMMSGQFTLDDFLNQIKMIQQMGSLKDVMEKVPGLSGMMPPGANIEDKELTRIESMIHSMTRAERNDPHVLVREPSRVRRVAKGSGSQEPAVQELIQKFLFMQQMMSNMGGMGGMMGGLGGMLGKIPGMKGLAAARHLRRAMKGGGAPGMPGMPAGMGFPGMMGSTAGMGGSSAESPKMRTLSQAERNARKNKRKSERDARKKGKGHR